ncbi:GGDEF domain-containing protein [Hydrogenophaga sp. OTU3427]|uniref:GGDEF domain-containing protein n=1 Tax=Hydrogenophaga sp. OTU3427 TaxID=3043856 RepID=UPI00406C5D6A
MPGLGGWQARACVNAGADCDCGTGGFHAHAQRAMARSERHGKPSFLLLMDIDHFKKINDSRGQVGGEPLAIRCRGPRWNWGPSDADIEAKLARADEQLWRAKHQGRNQVCARAEPALPQREMAPGCGSVSGAG